MVRHHWNRAPLPTRQLAAKPAEALKGVLASRQAGTREGEKQQSPGRARAASRTHAPSPLGRWRCATTAHEALQGGRMQRDAIGAGPSGLPHQKIRWPRPRGLPQL